MMIKARTIAASRQAVMFWGGSGEFTILIHRQQIKKTNWK